MFGATQGIHLKPFFKKRKFLKCRRKRISFQGLSDLDETGKANI